MATRHNKFFVELKTTSCLSKKRFKKSSLSSHFWLYQHGVKNALFQCYIISQLEHHVEHTHTSANAFRRKAFYIFIRWKQKK